MVLGGSLWVPGGPVQVPLWSRQTEEPAAEAWAEAVKTWGWVPAPNKYTILPDNKDGARTTFLKDNLLVMSDLHMASICRLCASLHFQTSKVPTPIGFWI